MSDDKNGPWEIYNEETKDYNKYAKNTKKLYGG